MFKCQHPGCSFTHKTRQGLASHNHSHLSDERKAEIIAKRKATIVAKKGNVVSVDDVFNRIEQATKILFPDPAIFYERFEEIAELRNQMLQALTR